MRIPKGVFVGLIQYRTVGVVLLATIAGLIVPLPNGMTELVTPIVVLLIYGSFRDLSVSDTGVEFLALTIGGLVIAYTLIPVAATFVGGYLLPSDALLGVAVITAGPTTAGSALVWTRLEGGETALTASVAIASLILAPVAVPAVLSVLVFEHVSLAVRPIVRELLVLVVGGGGLVVLLPNEHLSDDRLDTIFLVAIGILVYVSVAAHKPQGFPVRLIAAIGITAVVPIVGVLVLTSGVRRLWGVPVKRTRAVFFATALKNLGIALVVASVVGAGDITLAIIECYVVQQLAAGLVVGST